MNAPFSRDFPSVSNDAVAWRPGKLWSLWDMLQFDAAHFVVICQSLQAIRMALHQHSGGTDLLDDKIKAALEKNRVEIVDALKVSLERASEELERLDLKFSLAEVKRAQERLVEHNRLPTTAEIDEISSRIRDELDESRFFQITKERAKYYDPDESPFGKEVAVKFPSAAVFEIDEAAKCLAFNRGTACVFHLMRTLEVGIKAAGRCLSIPDPVRDADRNWGAMLRKLKDEIDRRNRAAPSQWPAATDKDFFAEIYASLDAVRNVWRNATMHVENKYTEAEAEHIFNAVRGFMMKLASRMDEGGQPLA